MRFGRQSPLRSLVLFVMATTWCGVAPADEPAIELLDVPLTPKIARQCFEEARSLAEKDGGELWGVKLTAPLLFVDPETRAIITSQADGQGRLTPKDGVFVGTLPADETIAGTAKHWAGVTWVMLPWPLPKERCERLHMFAHETWHCFQHQLGLPPHGPANRHLDTRDGRIWLRLEWRALQAALETSGKKRHQAVADALTFRAHRRSLFPDAAAEERALEMHEGLAEYTGVRLSRDSDQAAAARAIKNVKLSRGFPTLVFSFAYVSGPLYGLLLDDAKPDWRKGLTPEHDLGRMLADALSISPPDDLPAAAQKRAGDYDADKLILAETKRENNRQQRLGSDRHRFVEGPLLILPVVSMDFQFDPRDVHPLDDLGKVYPKMKITDAWGILEVTGGALIAADWSRVIVPAPSDTTARPLKGDGWKLQLKEGWELRVAERKGDYIVKRASDE